MKIFYDYTKAPNGGFGVLGKGIQKALESDSRFTLDDLHPDILFTYGMPDLIPHYQKLFPKAFHVHYWVWESSELPKSFVKEYKKVDLLITACKWSRNIGRKQGLQSEIWHHGIDDRFHYIERNNETFTFLHYNAYEFRKGWEIALEAFLKEFKPNEKVKLILKARERKESMWLFPKKRLTQEDYAKSKQDPNYLINSLSLGYPNIKEIIGHVSDEEMVRINQEANCFVFPAKGEGWGLPPMEAAATGMIPILPNKGCFTEWFDTETMIENKISGWINSEPRYPGVMFYPSVSDLRKKMRMAFNEWTNNREEWDRKARLGADRIKKKYNWNKIINDLYIILTQNVSIAANNSK